MKICEKTKMFYHNEYLNEWLNSNSIILNNINVIFIFLLLILFWINIDG